MANGIISSKMNGYLKEFSGTLNGLMDGGGAELPGFMGLFTSNETVTHGDVFCGQDRYDYSQVPRGLDFEGSFSTTVTRHRPQMDCQVPTLIYAAHKSRVKIKASTEDGYGQDYIDNESISIKYGNGGTVAIKHDRRSGTLWQRTHGATVERRQAKPVQTNECLLAATPYQVARHMNRVLVMARSCLLFARVRAGEPATLPFSGEFALWPAACDGLPRVS